jgi:NAD+ kinase
MKRFHRIGIIHHGLIDEARELAHAIAARYDDGRKWWLATQDTLQQQSEELDEADLIVTIGGDGTILRAVHLAAPRGIPLVGVNMGRVGFMSEIESAEALEGLAWYLDGNARVEERCMLRTQIEDVPDSEIHSLNDVTVARGAALRMIEVSTVVDGVHLATYRGDGVVIATATGSTGYTLALGGPVMDPSSQDYLVKPIATHMSQFGGVILQSTSLLHLTVYCDEPATLNADGFFDQPLQDGQTVLVTHSTFKAKFLRKQPPTAFWGDLSRKLGIRKGSVNGGRRSRHRRDSGTMGDDGGNAVPQ